MQEGDDGLLGQLHGNDNLPEVSMRCLRTTAVVLLLFWLTSLLVGAEEKATPPGGVKVSIRFRDCPDYDFKAAGEGSTKCGITAYNLKFASRFEIKSGKLIIEVPKDSGWLQRNTKRNAPYGVVDTRLPVAEGEVAGFKADGILNIAAVSTGESSPFIIFSDSVGVPGDGNSQVFVGYGGGVFAALGRYRVLSRDELEQPVTEAMCAELGRAELHQLKYWRKLTGQAKLRVGEVVFNFWD